MNKVTNSGIPVSEVAAELGATPKEVISKAKDLDIELKTAQSKISIEQAGLISDYFSTGKIPNVVLKAQEKLREEKAKEEKAKIKKEIKKTILKTDKKEEVVKEIVAKEEIKKTIDKKEEGVKEIVAKEEIKEEEIKKTIDKKEEGVKEITTKGLLSKKRDQRPMAEKEAKINATPSQSKKVKKVKKSPSKLSQKSKITINSTFNSDVDIEGESSNVLMPDFDTREDILKKFEKANNLLNKNKRPAIKTKNPYAKQSNTPERGRSRKRSSRFKLQKDKPEPIIRIPIDIRVHEFATKIDQEDIDIVNELLELGVEANKNDFLEKEYMELLADTFKVKIEFVSEHIDEINYIEQYESTSSIDEDMKIKTPVITIMGHVDHGKTTLLDTIRETKITEGEAGGITQHIGAYMVDFKGHKMTFIDTPGHAAFDQMRARGSQITDIIIIVVSADDGVKDQSIESIKHAKKAKVPIIVAITKIDRPEANIDLVKSQMAEQEITPSDWGGDVDFIPISAKTKEGLDELLETISVQAELLECKANPKREAKAVVIEAFVEVGKGPTASLIIQDGTLNVGDYVIADTVSGRVRSISDDDNKTIESALPGMPVTISGLDDLPPIGSILVSMQNAKEAKNLAQKRASYKRQMEMSKTTRVSIEDLTSMISESKLTVLPIIIKADFNGSLEAIKKQLESFKNEEVKVNIIFSGVGGISEKDLDLARATDNCVIFGFNVRPTGMIKQKADKDNIVISTYAIIYELFDEVKSMLSGLMSPIIRQENTGQANVRNVFKTPKGIAIAGCMVEDGKVLKGGLARVIREGVVICDNSNISSLKRFKDDVQEVKKGYECGIAIEDYNDVQVGDVIETFIEKEEKQKL